MLRPAFTQHLADTLLVGNHVNLVSPHGRGRRQTLLDLETLLGDVRVRKIDLKRDQKAWDRWLKETLTSLGQVIVIIHNIESMTDNQKQPLEALKRFTLLCVSEFPLQDKALLSIEIPE